MLTAPSSGRFVNQSSFQSKKIIYKNNYQQIWIEDLLQLINFSRELTAGFCIYQQQQQENNNKNLEPATPSMLGVA